MISTEPFPYIILALSATDMILTNYSFELMKKKKAFNPKDELGFIQRIIIGQNPGPAKALIGILINFPILSLIMFLLNFDPLAIGVFTGMLVIPNYIHVINLAWIFKNWNNEVVWDMKRKTAEFGI